MAEDAREPVPHSAHRLLGRRGPDVGVEDLDLDVTVVADRRHGGRHRAEVDHAVAEVTAALVKHVVLPALGVVAVGIPIYYLFNPSPPTQPYDWFPWVGLGLVVASIIYAMWLVRRDPGLGDRVGSIIADE